MAIDFPNSPTTNQIFTVGSRSWIWDGIIWAIYSNNPVLYRQDSPPSDKVEFPATPGEPNVETEPAE